MLALPKAIGECIEAEAGSITNMLFIINIYRWLRRSKMGLIAFQAIGECIEAAAVEFDDQLQNKLLKSAAYGKPLSPSTPSPNYNHILIV